MAVDVDTARRWAEEDRRRAEEERARETERRGGHVRPTYADILALNTLVKSEWFSVWAANHTVRGLPQIVEEAQAAAVEQFPQERPA